MPAHVWRRTRGRGVAGIEIPPTEDSAAAASALQTRQPLPPAAEPGRRVGKRDELIDVRRAAVLIGQAIHEACAVALPDDADRAPSAPRLETTNGRKTVQG